MHTSSAAGEKDALDVNVYVDGELRSLHGEGNGPIAAFVNAINGLEQNYDVRVLDYAEHALSSGGDAVAAAYVECLVRDQVYWGVGIDANIVTASLKAVISAVNRASATCERSEPLLVRLLLGGDLLTSRARRPADLPPPHRRVHTTRQRAVLFQLPRPAPTSITHRPPVVREHLAQPDHAVGLATPSASAAPPAPAASSP